MIDNMAKTLMMEQKDDDKKKAYCEKQFDEADDEKKGFERTVGDINTMIADAKESLQRVTEEIKAFEDSIMALDKSMKDATEQRKEEHAEYQEQKAENSAAKELLRFARKRLDQVYHPKKQKAAAAASFFSEDRGMYRESDPYRVEGMDSWTGAALLQVDSEEVDVEENGKPAMRPKIPKLGASGQKDRGNAVLNMIDTLIHDLDSEMTLADVEEKDAQEDYEKASKDAEEKRDEDSKALTDKESARAELMGTLEGHENDKKEAAAGLKQANQYIASLHQQCDFLMKYYVERKQARSNEVDALQKAKAVLNGAGGEEYSFVQVSATQHRPRRNLRHRV